MNGWEREVGTVLYGRRMWETMRGWADAPDDASVTGEFGRIWRAQDKVVHSSSLPALDAPRARLERRFDPAAVRALVAASPSDVSIGGATLAGSALTAGLVDEIRLLVVPNLVGSGPRALPDGLRSELDLLEARRLDAGWLLLRYAVGDRP